MSMTAKYNDIRQCGYIAVWSNGDDFILAQRTWDEFNTLVSLVGKKRIGEFEIPNGSRILRVERVPDDINIALHLNDNDRQRSLAMIDRIIGHIADGEYNTEVIEKLRAIIKIEKRTDIGEGKKVLEKLAGLPPRDETSAVIEWCLNALFRFSEERLHQITFRKQIRDRLKKIFSA